MVYGHFYSPLFYSGLGELMRTADAATVWRARQLGMTDPKESRFAERVIWLAEQGAIHSSNTGWWGQRVVNPQRSLPRRLSLLPARGLHRQDRLQDDEPNRGPV
jgi:hypothetical protein